MDFSFKFLLALVESGTTGARPDLSEAALLARHPSLAVGLAVLVLLGLGCDVYLVGQLIRAKQTQVPLLKIATKPWGLEELLVTIGGIGGVLIIFGLASPLLHLDRESMLPTALLLELVLRLALLVGLAVFLHRRRINWRETFGFRAPARRGALTMGVVFYLGILPPLLIVFIVYALLFHALGIKPEPQPIADLLLNTNSATVLSLLVGFALLIAPLFEEVFFRGFAYPALKQRWGTLRALLMVSGVFALAHFHGPSVAPLFVLAIGLGLAYEYTGSLLAPITMHALFNATNVVMLLYARTHS